MTTIINTILLLCAIGILAGLALYFVAKKFKTEENPLYDEVESMLPGANCGGCGYPGCRKLAEKMVDSPTLEGLYCSVGGNETMEKIASFLGKAAAQKEMQVAVVRCNGSCDKREKLVNYEGIQSCAFAANFSAGDTGCSFGCIGFGDCEAVCQFGGIKINKETLLPEVDTALCTACGQCVNACPKHIIELRKTNKKDMKIYVACSNKDKGAVARKACTAACIGCGKCTKVCPNEAIVVTDFLAYIDANACKLCRKCVEACPTGAITETNFPVRKKAEETNS
ncbi:MAG: RnfABCDGE type electron transport complex subunit B [Bacteroidales bacterium]|nr:RnfABCDGE type electron transport complex subunit B [Bacteroidales bacterium]